MKPALLACAGLLLLLNGPAPAQEPTPAGPAARYAEAAASLDADLRGELARLAAVRERIAAERPPLAREAEQVAGKLRTQRRQADLAIQTNEALQDELNKLEREILVWRDEQAYIRSLLEDYRTRLATQVGLAELHEVTANDGAASLSALLDRVERAVGRLEGARGGQILPGKVTGPDGAAHAGTFVQVGPVEWFVAKEGGLAGLAVARPGLRAEVAPKTGDGPALSALAAGEAARPVFDPTLGTALAIQAANPGILEHIRAGGIWMIPILLLGLTAMVVAGVKWLQILTIKDLRSELIQEVLASLRTDGPEAALCRLQRLRHPARALLERGVEAAGQPRQFVEEAMYEKFVAAQPALQRGLPLIAIASGAAPLFGLLGTVTGMIHTFQLIQIFGSGNARSLASGISEALITTEYGLIVAIPALVLHAFLSRKIKGILGAMEMASLAFLNGIESRLET